MTELEQARAHLRQTQNRLAGHRAAGFNQFFVYAKDDPDCFARKKADVLAALSWVWDAQERAGVNLVADAWFESLRFDPAGILIMAAETKGRDVA
jgi:hypothetical protein